MLKLNIFSDLAEMFLTVFLDLFQHNLFKFGRRFTFEVKTLPLTTTVVSVNGKKPLHELNELDSSLQ